MNSNIEVKLMVKVIQHFEGLQYNRNTDTFQLNGKMLSQFKIRRFIADNVDTEITVQFVDKIIKRIKLRCNELSRHN